MSYTKDNITFENEIENPANWNYMIMENNGNEYFNQIEATNINNDFNYNYTNTVIENSLSPQFYSIPSVGEDINATKTLNYNENQNVIDTTFMSTNYRTTNINTTNNNINIITQDDYDEEYLKNNAIEDILDLEQNGIPAEASNNLYQKFEEYNTAMETENCTSVMETSQSPLNLENLQYTVGDPIEISPELSSVIETLPPHTKVYHITYSAPGFLLNTNTLIQEIEIKSPESPQVQNSTCTESIVYNTMSNSSNNISNSLESSSSASPQLQKTSCTHSNLSNMDLIIKLVNEETPSLLKDEKSEYSSDDDDIVMSCSASTSSASPDCPTRKRGRPAKTDNPVPVLTEDDLKDELRCKYIKMRNQNNQSSRRSRQTRKQRDAELEQVAHKLESRSLLLKAEEKRLRKECERWKRASFKLVTIN